MLRCLFLVLCVFHTSNAWAADRYVTVDVVPGVTTAVPGEAFTVYIDQKIAPGWHTYWKNPGDSGVATSITWDAPAGTTTTDLAYPIPSRIPFGPMVNFGYADRAVLTTQMTIPTDFKDDHFTATAKIDWLVCNDICIPESGTYKVDVGVGKSVKSDETAIAYQDYTDWAYPKKVDWLVEYSQYPSSWGARKSLPVFGINLLPDADTTNFLQSLDDNAQVEFFPEEWGLIQNPAEQDFVESDDQGGLFYIETARGERALSDITDFNGLIVVTDNDGVRHGYDVHIQPSKMGVGDELSTQNTVIPAEAGIQSTPDPLLDPGLRRDDMPPVKIVLFPVIALAFLAGLILNLMPCVLPVLFIKVLSLAGLSGSEQKHAQMHGLLYAMGVVATFVILGLLLITAQQLGASVGWGFQLQSPVFVAFLVAVFMALTINLMGGFQIDFIRFIPSRFHTIDAHSHVGSFLTGVLAVVVATPCTVPFMGAAVAYALTHSAPVTIAIFTSMGAGLAAPFVILTFIPQAITILPKPGKWMITFRRICAVPMALTAIWLSSVFVHQVGVKDPVVEAIKADMAQPYTPAALTAALNTAQPVLVNMTAAWCITCKVNEHMALNRAETKSLFADNHVIYMVGDWTSGDPAITAYLNEFGRKGVPLYVYYPVTGTSRGAPVVLPQLLSPEILRKAIVDSQK